jgi:hypothetical protein
MDRQRTQLVKKSPREAIQENRYPLSVGLLCRFTVPKLKKASLDLTNRDSLSAAGKFEDRRMSLLCVRTFASIDIGTCVAIEAGSLLIFALDGFVDFLTMDWDTGGGFDAQPNLVTTNVHNRDNHIISDHDAFIAMS